MIVTTPAKRDIAAIRARIAQDDARDAARFVRRLHDRLQKLATLGHSGNPRDALGPDLRILVHGKYNIYFRVTATETTIIRVLHSARDVRRFTFHEDPAPPILSALAM